VSLTLLCDLIGIREIQVSRALFRVEVRRCCDAEPPGLHTPVVVDIRKTQGIEWTYCDMESMTGASFSRNKGAGVLCRDIEICRPTRRWYRTLHLWAGSLV
jgi:hypothetical protein